MKNEFILNNFPSTPLWKAFKMSTTAENGKSEKKKYLVAQNSLIE
jgi:hypothetical protein